MNRFAAVAAMCVCVSLPAFADEPDGLVLPEGFHASIVADGLKGLRHLAFRNKDTLYISTRGKDNGIIALHLGADHKADRTEHFRRRRQWRHRHPHLAKQALCLDPHHRLSLPIFRR